MSRPSTTFLFHALAEGVEQIKVWIGFIGVVGITSSLILFFLGACWSACGFSALNRIISLALLFVLPPVALISALSGLKVLQFVSGWQEKYGMLSKTEDEKRPLDCCS
jgi:hypothetical protein